MILDILAFIHRIEFFADSIEQLCLKVLLFCFVHIPSILHLCLRKQMSLIFFDNVKKMFFNLDDSRPQVGLKQIFHSLHFHSEYIQVLSIIAMTLLSLRFLRYFSVFSVYLLANCFNQGVLVWQNFWRHFFLPQKLLHLESINVQRTLGSVYFVDHWIVLSLRQVLIVDIFLILIAAIYEILSEPLREEWRSVVLLNSRWFLRLFFSILNDLVLLLANFLQSLLNWIIHLDLVFLLAVL